MPRCKLVIRRQQTLVQRAAFEVGAQGVEAEEAFGAVEQRLCQFQRGGAVQQFECLAVVVRFVELEDGFDAAVDQQARRGQVVVVADPVAAFQHCFFVAHHQRQQGFQFAEAQLLPGRAGWHCQAQDFPHRPLVVEVRCLQLGQQ